MIGSEFTSEDDGDVCNLGSINFDAVRDVVELRYVTELAAKFLYCGTITGELPYDKSYDVRNKNRKIGLGLMGVHAWLLKHGYDYEVNAHLTEWLSNWAYYSEIGANKAALALGLPTPKKYRAVAPAGTISMLASTTSGIEPLYAVAYKRRYLTNGTQWKYQYVIDATAQRLIDEHGLNPDSIETAHKLAHNPEKRIKFQYDVQRFVDMAISSTINLPSFEEQTFTPQEFSDILLKYIEGLRGITCYPDGSRGGQPLTVVPYDEAKKDLGVVFDEDENKCKGGVCGL